MYGIPEHGLRLAERQPAADDRATALMERFRAGGGREVFDELTHLTSDLLLRRARHRLRYCGDRIDPYEVVQDAFINIFRYPDRFDARRPAAFRTWATTIVDNVIRRHLRRQRRQGTIALRSLELLELEPDRQRSGPQAQAIGVEESGTAALAYQLFLGLYLSAYQTLTPRERFVLQMIEVRGLRYAELGSELELRPEALKMVVFRARRRIFEWIEHALPALDRPQQPPVELTESEPRWQRGHRRPAAVAG
jgi:RNA polymerase sigma factor (sigma-70 family)